MVFWGLNKLKLKANTSEFTGQYFNNKEVWIWTCNLQNIRAGWNQPYNIDTGVTDILENSLLWQSAGTPGYYYSFPFLVGQFTITTAIADDSQGTLALYGNREGAIGSFNLKGYLVYLKERRQ